MPESKNLKGVYFRNNTGATSRSFVPYMQTNIEFPKTQRPNKNQYQ